MIIFQVNVDYSDWGKHSSGQKSTITQTDKKLLYILGITEKEDITDEQ